MVHDIAKAERGAESDLAVDVQPEDSRILPGATETGTSVATPPSGITGLPVTITGAGESFEVLTNSAHSSTGGKPAAVQTYWRRRRDVTTCATHQSG
jgi:hypothetical protein